jgi:hypothetical protein
MQVQNQREYAAMLKEIDSVQAQVSEHEEAVLKDMEEIEVVKTELAKHQEHIREERRKVGAERAEVEAAVARAGESISELESERKRIESELPRKLVFTIQRLEESRQGQFLSQAEEGVCQSCFVRVRPQGFQEVKLASKIHFCSNCRRLLYHEPSLERMRAEAEAERSGNAGSEAVNAADGSTI